MLNKLKWQFVFINMVLVLLVIFPTFMYMHFTLKKEMFDDSMMAMEEGMRQFDLPEGAEVKDFNPLDAREPMGKAPNIDARFNNFFNTMFVELDSDNNVLRTHSRSNYTIEEESLKVIIDEILQSDLKQGEIEDLNLRYMVNVKNGSKYIALLDTSYEKMVLADQSRTFVLIACLIFIVFFGISIILSKVTIKPIEKSWNQQQQFISDVSHELKTPTAVILANTSILALNENLKEDKKWVDYIDIEARRMKKLIDDLLFLSRSDGTKDEKVLYNIPISDVVLNTTLPFEALIFELDRKLELETDIDKDLYIKGDESQIKQLLTILIDNALKYSLDNSKITISLKHDSNKNRVVLKVNNPSLPIEKDDLEHIFDRFYKVDKARTRTENSYGLGLAIAKEIVTSHKGKISVSNSIDRGTTFKVTFNNIES